MMIETTRLRLREMTVGDLDAVADMLAHPDVARAYERAFTRTDAAEWIERQVTRYARDGHGFWLMTERESGVPVGQAGLISQAVDDRIHCEVAWLLHPMFWGRGYATEAAAAVCDAAFQRWDCDHVISLIRPVNVRSQRVAERIGMTAGERVEFHALEHIVYHRHAWPPSSRSPGSTNATGG